MKPYQKSSGNVVHRQSRKARFSATQGFLNPRRYRNSKQAWDAAVLRERPDAVTDKAGHPI